MKIAWFTPYQQGSAIAKFSSLVVPALAARGHSITLFSSDRQPPIEHRRLPEGIELLHWSLFETAPEIADAYDLIVYNVGDQPDYHFGVLKLIDRYTGVCIFHDFYLVDLFFGWCATEIEKPLAHFIVVSIYGEEIAKEFWARIGQPDFQNWAASHVPMTEWVARKALAAVAHAPFYKQRLADSSAGPVTVIPLAYNAPANIARLRDKNGPVRILSVGVVNPNKRVEAMINAVAGSPALRSRCEYNIVGRIESSYRARLQSLITDSGLEDAVHVHGEVSDFELHWRFVEADVLACLRWPALEGASASCIEAMSYGKAVIVIDTGFYSSIPSDCVLKVSLAREAQELAQHLETVVIDVDERDALGKRALDWARREYAPETYSERIEPLLEAAAEGRPSADALKQIGLALRAMGVQYDDPIVSRVGSEFRTLFCGVGLKEQKCARRPAISHTDPRTSIF
jgi:glycosyltransferase involved in cell wall biosynthesis